MTWQTAKSAPHVRYRIDEAGDYLVEDTRNGQEYFARSDADLTQLIADLSSTKEYVPIGDHLHKLADFFGLERCQACAERQARLNRLLRRRG